MRFMVLDFADIEARKEAYNSSSDFDRGVVHLAITWSKILGIKRNDIISVKHGTQRAFYAVKFHYTLNKGEIALDYDQRSFLDLKKGRRASLILQKAWPLNRNVPVSLESSRSQNTLRIQDGRVAHHCQHASRSPFEWYFRLT